MELVSSHLDQDQRAAVDKILRAEDVCVVLGMPGAGNVAVVFILRIRLTLFERTHELLNIKQGKQHA